jgi:hypothetical protein
MDLTKELAYESTARAISRTRHVLHNRRGFPCWRAFVQLFSFVIRIYFLSMQIKYIDTTNKPKTPLTKHHQNNKSLHSIRTHQEHQPQQSHSTTSHSLHPHGANNSPRPLRNSTQSLMPPWHRAARTGWEDWTHSLPSRVRSIGRVCRWDGWRVGRKRTWFCSLNDAMGGSADLLIFFYQKIPR